MPLSPPGPPSPAGPPSRVVMPPSGGPSVHVPAPLHVPGAHSPSGSVPLAWGEQVPPMPGTLHASHVPSHASEQHTPSAHEPLVHSLGRLQPAPLPRSASHRDDALQCWPSGHSASLEQESSHAVEPAQRPDIQVIAAPGVHAPPIHVGAGESAPPAQDAVPHTVPDGRADHDVVESDGMHAWHGFDGFDASAAMHEEAIKQPVETVAPHESLDSLHISVVHDRPSLHASGAPVQTPDVLHASPIVQN